MDEAEVGQGMEHVARGGSRNESIGVVPEGSSVATAISRAEAGSSSVEHMERGLRVCGEAAAADARSACEVDRAEAGCSMEQMASHSSRGSSSGRSDCESTDVDDTETAENGDEHMVCDGKRKQGG